MATQAAYLTFGTATPSATNGLTLPAGSVQFFPVMGDIVVRSATTGSVINAIPLT